MQPADFFDVDEAKRDEVMELTRKRFRQKVMETAWVAAEMAMASRCNF